MLLLRAIRTFLAGTVGAAWVVVWFLAPVALAQIFTEPMPLPEGIAATGDTLEVRALTAWAEEHRHRNPQQADQVALRALTLAQELDDQRGIGWVLMTLGKLALGASVDQAETYFMEAQEVFEQSNDERGLAYNQVNRANVYELRGRLEQSLDAYLIALKNLERLDDSGGRERIRALNNIGVIYYSQGNTDSALEHYEYAATLAEERGDFIMLAQILGNIAGIYANNESYDIAQDNLYRALFFLEENGSYLYAIGAYVNLGILSNMQGHHEQALAHLLTAESLAEEHGEGLLRLGSSIRYRELGKAYMGLGEYDRALYYAHEALAIAQEAGAVSYQMAAHEVLSEMYETAGNPVHALAHYREYASARDAIFNAERVEIISEMQTRYETEEQKRANEHLAQQNRLQALQLTLSLAGMGSLLLILGVLYYRYRLKQRANRLLEELDTAKSRFFANISHEFRTPLTVILGSMQDALAGRFGKTTDLITEQHQVVLRNTRQLQRLINEVLDLNRLESGHLELRPAPGDFVRFFKHIVEANAPLAERNGITLTLACDIESCPRLYDEEKLEKIVGNLLSNALKFTPRDGSVRVDVRCGDQVEISVADEGPGIPPEAQASVFERFAQLDHGVLKGGTGIGLALAKELTVLHGGTITLESEPGKGSTFTMRLPLERTSLSAVQEGTYRDSLEPIHVETSSGDGHAEFPLSPWERRSEDEGDQTTVLIIEDNDDVRAYVRRSLEDAYRILEAVDGESGLQKARSELPDLIVSDVMLPGVDGYYVAERLKAEPSTECIPVVMLTARASEQDHVTGYGSGAEVYLTKPFSPETLRSVVARLLEERLRLRRRLQADTKTDAGATLRNNAPTLLDRARAIVLENLHDENFGVEELASTLGMSLRTLQHHFRSDGELSPSDFVRILRLERACELLRDGAGSVSEVAYAVGFNSLSVFSRNYRAHYGAPPSVHLLNRKA